VSWQGLQATVLGGESGHPADQNPRGIPVLRLKPQVLRYMRVAVLDLPEDRT
jgi:hypothetical protein